MTEAQALAIERNDWDMITYFVQSMAGLPAVRTYRGWELLNDRNPNWGREVIDAEKTTRRRAAGLAQMSVSIGQRTTSALRGFLQAAESLPGRKTVFFDLSRLVSINENKGKTEGLANAAPPTAMEIYAKARTVVDPSAEELRGAYPAEMSDLTFTENQDELGSLLQKVGGAVEMFFRDFPNTASKEKIRLERLLNDGRVDDRLDQSYNYTIEISSDGKGVQARESRSDSRGRPLQRERLKGISAMTSGFAAASIFFYPNLQSTSRMRHIGRQISKPNAYVIAIAQKPIPEAPAGNFQMEGMPPTPLCYQGLAWVDPQSCQIVRMRTDLLAPRSDAGLTRQTSEIWFSEVDFNPVSHPFWLPREVVVTHKWLGVTFRNRHQYSDYVGFLAESRDKLELPRIKKSPCGVANFPIGFPTPIAPW